MANSEAGPIGGPQSLLSLLARAVDPTYEPQPSTPLILSAALAAQQSTDFFLQDYMRHHVALHERIKVLWKELRELQGNVRTEVLGLVVTSDFPRGLVEERRMVFSLQVIDRNGSPRGLCTPVNCELTIEEYVQSKRHGKQSNQVFEHSWNGVIGVDGRVEFRGVLLPEYESRTRKCVTITVTCQDTESIAPLVIEDLSVSKHRVRKAKHITS